MRRQALTLVSPPKTPGVGDTGTASKRPHGEIDTNKRPLKRERLTNEGALLDYLIDEDEHEPNPDLRIENLKLKRRLQRYRHKLLGVKKAMSSDFETDQKLEQKRLNESVEVAVASQFQIWQEKFFSTNQEQNQSTLETEKAKDDLKIQCDTLGEELNNLKKDYTSLLVLQESLKEELVAGKKDHRTLTTEHDSLKKENGGLKKEMGILSKERDTLVNEKDCFLNQLKKLKNEFESIKKEHQYLTEERVSLRTDLSQTKISLYQSQEECNFLKKELQKIQNESVCWKDERTQLHNQRKQLEIELISVKQSFEFGTKEKSDQEEIWQAKEEEWASCQAEWRLKEMSWCGKEVEWEQREDESRRKEAEWHQKEIVWEQQEAEWEEKEEIYRRKESHLGELLVELEKVRGLLEEKEQNEKKLMEKVAQLEVEMNNAMHTQTVESSEILALKKTLEEEQCKHLEEKNEAMDRICKLEKALKTFYYEMNKEAKSHNRKQ